ncbi:MAG TPA: serine hydrolase domain-containing protein [Pseudonocardia sp.]|nr:serine hydrolase domain-containing protein [Pseudonocardia sp.]
MPKTDLLDLDTRIDAILNRRPAVGLAVGVVRDGSLEFFTGRGLADIASSTPVTEDTAFRVGSLTKTFTAIAVMQLWEQGSVDLDAPADEYLRAYPLIPADPTWRPATVRHLLTHTAGIGEVLHPSGVVRPLFGETVKAGRPVPSPAEYYRPGLRIRAEPGTRWRYTDHGFATLGQIVEDVTGQPFDRYLREHVFAPLGMADTGLVRPARSRPATGYTVRSRGPEPIADYEVVTAGGAAAWSTPGDMGRYLAALLGHGANEHGSVLEPSTLATMFQPQYRPDPRVPGLGLAFFRGTAGGHAVLEHQGVVPAFTSQVFLAPDDGLAVMAFTNGTRDGMFWLPVETGKLFHHLLGVPDEVIRDDVPHHPEVWGDICGWYALSGPLTDVRARGMIGVGAEVFVRRGRPFLRCLAPVPALYRGIPLHPDDPRDPDVFRIDLAELGGTVRVVFSRRPGTGTTTLHFAVMPFSAEKRPATTNPRRWATGALVAAATATAVRRRRRAAT